MCPVDPSVPASPPDARTLWIVATAPPAPLRSATNSLAPLLIKGDTVADGRRLERPSFEATPSALNAFEARGSRRLTPWITGYPTRDRKPCSGTLTTGKASVPPATALRQRARIKALATRNQLCDPYHILYSGFVTVNASCHIICDELLLSSWPEQLNYTSVKPQ